MWEILACLSGMSHITWSMLHGLLYTKERRISMKTLYEQRKRRASLTAIAKLGNRNDSHEHFSGSSLYKSSFCATRYSFIEKQKKLLNLIFEGSPMMRLPAHPDVSGNMAMCRVSVGD